MLVKIHPADEYFSFTGKLSSPYVSRELVKRNYGLRHTLWDRIEDGAHTATASSLYEDAWHCFLQHEGLPRFELKCRRPGRTETEMRLFRGNLTGELTVGAAKVGYYQPSTSFAAFDSWSRDGGFQVTMGLSHEIKMKGNASYPRAVLKALWACFPGSPVP